VVSRFHSLLLLGCALSVRGDSFTRAEGPQPADALTEQARLRVAPGLKVELWAAEPLVQNITSFCFDSQGRAYVVETGRRRTSVFDIRGLQPWLDDDYSFRTVNDRANFLKRVLTPGDPDHEKFLGAVVRRGGFEDFNHDGVIDARDLEVESERIRLVWDGHGVGHADTAMTFADGFHSPVSGVAAGVLAQGTNVWFTCIPDLWRFPAATVISNSVNSESVLSRVTGPTLNTRPLLTGFGVHIAFGGHDLHGLVKGPDGRLYFSIADRGTCVTNREGKVISLPDSGAIFRCEPDGADFEIFAKGLRNPQELCFDDFGNLWTADNNADGGDKARWTLVLEGADYGWTIGWQWLPKLGAWNSERLWHTRASNTAAYIVPPVAHIGHGPAGIAYYPGTGMPARYDRHFFVSDFPGGVRTFTVEPDGAFFKVGGQASSLSGPADFQPAAPANRLEARSADAGRMPALLTNAAGLDDGRAARPASMAWLEDNSTTNLTGKLLWDLSPVDVAFPPGGGVMVADWVQGWDKTGKGRLWHVFDPALTNDPLIAETKRLLAEGMTQRGEKELLKLLGHRDQRVRLEAQWELAGRGAKSFASLKQVAFDSKNQLARVHALWGIGQLVRQDKSQDFVPELEGSLGLLNDADSEVKAQAARMFGEARLVKAQNQLQQLIGSSDERVALLAILGWQSLYPSHRSSEIGMLRFRRTKTEQVTEQIDTTIPESLMQNLAIEPLSRVLNQPRFISPALLHAATLAIFKMRSANEDISGMRIDDSLFPPHWKMRPDNPQGRLALLLTERRQISFDIGTLAVTDLTPFLGDPYPQLVLEAARAINDVPMPKGMPELAALITFRLDRAEQVSPARRSVNRDLFASVVTNWPPELNFTHEEWRTWVLRRAVNANFRLGKAMNATALADFAARTDAPESVRVEALEDLADWPQPPKRDKIVGLYRPLPARDPGPARTALAAVWPQLVADTAPTNIIVAALRAGAVLHLGALPATLTTLAAHSSPAERAEAAKFSAAKQTLTLADFIGQLERGTTAERQAAFAALGTSTNAAAISPLTEWLNKLLAGQVPPELQLDVLDAATKAAQASRLRSAVDLTELRSALTRWTNSLPKDDPLASYRPALVGGDVARGRKLFVERQDLACFRCHKLHGEGGEVGPDLTGIGRAKGREYVLRSILLPNAEIAAGFENVVLTRKDGATVTGVLKSETADALVLDTPEDGRVTVKKSDLTKRERGPSAMIEGLGELMTRQELRDVVAALAE
jgi:quinoprotein glucose dehydrogenase